MARKKAVPAAQAQEAATAPKEAPLQEPEAEPKTAAPEATSDPDPEPNQDPKPNQDPQPDPAGGRHTPYKAAVAVALAVLHKAVGLGTEDMLKPVGTLKQGAAVTVTGRMGAYAQLKNGLYILEAFLEAQPIS